MDRLKKWTLPIRTVSEANISEHWSKKKKRHDIQKRWVHIWWVCEKPKITLPCTIRLTRIAKRNLDSDNLPVSMKHVRDSIADKIFPGLAPGQADNSPEITWEYSQRKISKGDTTHAVEVEISQG